MVGFYGHGNEPSGSTKAGNFLKMTVFWDGVPCSLEEIYDVSEVHKIIVILAAVRT
jgi:hypothetical protein